MYKYSLDIESDIRSLLKARSGTVTELALANVLQRYNLKDGLVTIGRFSNFLFSANDENQIGRIAYKDPRTGIIFSQFALAYIANILLISGSNDYKSKYLSNKEDNLLALCNIYSNCLIDPTFTEDGRLTSFDNFREFMVRMNSEQMELQFLPHQTMSRSFVIFNDLINSIKPKKINFLSDIFYENTGLSLYDYLRIAFLIFAGAQEKTTINLKYFIDAEIPSLSDILTRDKLTCFLRVLASDYQAIKEEDKALNASLSPILTKTRWNPLMIYPVVEFNECSDGESYVIPNCLVYINKAFSGLYWWFHRYFEKQGMQKDFRTYFGYVFQEYVKKILQGIYGQDNVEKEVIYAKDKKFFDWLVEKDDKIYLFEVKAYQFALPSRQSGSKRQIINNEIKKVVEAMNQVYDRINDIKKYRELERFERKKVIPIIVFLDIPFVSGSLFKDWIHEALTKIEKDKGLDSLADLKINLLNIQELELFDDVKNQVQIEEVFEKLNSNPAESFESLLNKIKGKPLRNKYLDSIYKTFWDKGFRNKLKSH